MPRSTVASLLFLIVTSTVPAQLLLRDVLPGPRSTRITPFGVAEGRLVFGASTHTRYVPYLWRSQGTPATTQQVSLPQTLEVRCQSFGRLNRRLLFVGVGVAQTGLYSTDGTGPGTRLVAPLAIGGAPLLAAGRMTTGGSMVCFLGSTQNELALFRTDGTVTGTRMVRTFTGSTEGSWAFLNGKFYFTVAVSSSAEVWVTDGTPAGTVRVHRTGQWPRGFTAASGVTFFISPNRRLFLTDGTAIGTAPVPGFAMVVQHVVAYRGTLLVVAENGSDVELWRVDPITFRSARVATLVRNFQAQDQLWLLAARERVYIRTGAGPADAWTTDGTTGGTRQFLRKADGNVIWNAIAVGDFMVFSGTNNTVGRELFVTDGTRANTRPLFDIAPGIAGSAPQRFTLVMDLPVGPSLVFAAADPTHGFEPRILPLRAIGAAWTESVRPGCASSSSPPELAVVGGLPRLGTTTFGLEIRSRYANTLCGFFFDPRIGANFGPCATLLPSALMILSRTDASGSARLPIPVPNSQGLIGELVHAQALLARRGGAVFGAFDTTGIEALLIGR